MWRLAALGGVVVLLGSSVGGTGLAEPSGRIAFVSDRRGADNLYVVGADGSGPQELTHSFTPVADLNVSRARGQIVYARSETGDSSELWVATIRGTGPHRILGPNALVSAMQPAWSPDGRRVAFVRVDNEDDVSSESGYVMNVDGTGLHRITPLDRDVAEPAWSPDGQWIAVSDPCGIALVRPDGSRFHRLRIRGQTCATGPTWSPDGRRIAFAGGDGLYVAGRDGSGVRRIFRRRDAAIVTPEWSPDGRRIAFAAFGRSGPGGGIYVVRADGSHARLLPRSDGYSPSWSSATSVLFVRDNDLWRGDVAGHTARVADFRPAADPAWSPDGTGLLFTAWDRPDDPNVYELPARGGRWRSVLTSRRRDAQPAWSPDGRNIAYARGERFVWTAEADGRRQRSVAEGVDPDWSPDGRRLAYTVVAVWTAAADGSGRRRVTPPSAGPANLDADWSRDGKRIIYTRRAAAEGRPQIRIVNADGTGRRVFIRNASQGSWSPDGRFVVFVRGGDIWVRRLVDGHEVLLVSTPYREHSPAWRP